MVRLVEQHRMKEVPDNEGSVSAKKRPYPEALEIPIPRICSLQEYQVPLSDEIQSYLTTMYETHYRSLMATNKSNPYDVQGEDHPQGSALEKAQGHVERFCENLKQAPPQTSLRRTVAPPTKTADPDQEPRQRFYDSNDLLQRVQDLVKDWIDSASANESIVPQIQVHDTMNEVITVDLVPRVPKHLTEHKPQEPTVLPLSSLYNCRVPPPDRYPCLFPDWPTRQTQGWPLTHRAVVVDRFCGEAVLRGADIFVKGILAADMGIRMDDWVAVYAHVGSSSSSTPNRGLALQHYSGHCVLLGLGQSCCRDRSLFFSQSSGVGIRMSAQAHERAGPVLPPLSTILMDNTKEDDNTDSSSSLSSLLYAQNLPSMLVSRVLDPQPGNVIYDMCGAPGGKTSHLALLTQGPSAAAGAITTIVMSDKSRTKVLAAKSLFESLGLGDSIVPLHIDATKCVTTHPHDTTIHASAETTTTVQKVRIPFCRVAVLCCDKSLNRILDFQTNSNSCSCSRYFWNPKYRKRMASGRFPVSHPNRLTKSC